KPCELRRDTTVLIGSTVLIVALSQFGVLTRPMGAVLFAGIIAYVWLSYRSELKNPQLPSAHLHAEEAEEVIEVERPKSVWIGVALLVGGLAALVIGSRLLISGATDIALTFGVPQAVIGLTLVAIGTSLPELATSVIAAVRRHSDVAVGNVVGSGIFNLLAILGMTALVKPIGVADRIAHVDVWVMLAVTLALAPFLLIRGRIGRVAGGVAVGLYIVYAGLLLAGGAV
ncbi:MAG TPA: sodium:calcium antiporter, partial [Coriobacteriia bacterium]|nr:sodium:calcium antiporter [Coriobacteriia bacterium]